MTGVINYRNSRSDRQWKSSAGMMNAKKAGKSNKQPGSSSSSSRWVSPAKGCRAACRGRQTVSASELPTNGTRVMWGFNLGDTSRERYTYSSTIYWSIVLLHRNTGTMVYQGYGPQLAHKKLTRSTPSVQSKQTEAMRPLPKYSL